MTPEEKKRLVKEIVATILHSSIVSEERQTTLFTASLLRLLADELDSSGEVHKDAKMFLELIKREIGLPHEPNLPPWKPA